MWHIWLTSSKSRELGIHIHEYWVLQIRFLDREHLLPLMSWYDQDKMCMRRFLHGSVFKTLQAGLQWSKCASPFKHILLFWLQVLQMKWMSYQHWINRNWKTWYKISSVWTINHRIHDEIPILLNPIQFLTEYLICTSHSSNELDR